MGRTFVLGDIHGAYRALLQCLERSNFDSASDTLIFLGDVCDGWSETKQCVDKLMQIPNLIHLLGNHDFWFHNWLSYGEAEDIWLNQGGRATVESYKDGVPKEHITFMSAAKLYHEVDNRLFVHAGVPPGKRANECSQHQLIWDRTLPSIALTMGDKPDVRITLYDEVFIGHTPITAQRPVRCGEVWLMDTGAGWSGMLSMMDIHTKECFISDPVPGLYLGVQGRRRM